MSENQKPPKKQENIARQGTMELPMRETPEPTTVTSPTKNKTRLELKITTRPSTKLGTSVKTRTTTHYRKRTNRWSHYWFMYVRYGSKANLRRETSSRVTCKKIKTKLKKYSYPLPLSHLLKHGRRDYHYALIKRSKSQHADLRETPSNFIPITY